MGILINIWADPAFNKGNPYIGFLESLLLGIYIYIYINLTIGVYKTFLSAINIWVTKKIMGD